MNQKLSLIVCFAMVFFSGCASAPKLAPFMSMPSIPADETNLVEVDLKFEAKASLDDNAVQLALHKIAPNSSIVINVPSGLFEEQSKEKANDQDFKTQDFFNEAEQQIEKILIKNGFRVLSRSKFEAKLRKLRDEARCDINEWHCLYSQVSPEAQPILQNLKDKFDRSEIDALQYSDQIKLFKDKLQSASAGKRRVGDEKELTDISEVIRAAESGDIQSDYILQINIFDTEQKIKISTDLLHKPEVREFLRNNPGIKDEFERGNNIISCAAIGSNLNAKLVHVKTGEIVWIGEHQLNEFSSGIQNVTVEYGSRKYVSNEKDIDNFVSSQNTEYSRQKRYGKVVELPPFKYAYVLIPPTISSGRCEQSWNISREMKSSLARQVAKELMNTIKVE